MRWTFWVLTLFPKVWVLESLTMPLWNGASTHTQRFLHLLTYSSRWTSYNALLPKHTHPVLGPSQRTKHDSFSVSSCLFNFIMGSLRRFVMYTTGNSSCAPGALPLGSWAFYSPAVWRALLLWGTALSDKRWSTVIISITSWDILESLLVRRLEVADQFTSPPSATGRMKGRLCSVLTHSCLTSLCHSFLSGCDPVGIFWLNVGVCDPVQGPVSMWGLWRLVITNKMRDCQKSMKNQTWNTAEVLLKRLAHVATHDVTAALSVSMPSVLCAAHAASLSGVMQCCLTHVRSGLSLLYTVNFSVLLYVQILMFLQKWAVYLKQRL